MSVCIGDPMGFALDPLDPLERGVALELVVGVTSIERVPGQKIKCGGCEIPWDFGGVLTEFLAF